MVLAFSGGSCIPSWQCVHTPGDARYAAQRATKMHAHTRRGYKDTFIKERLCVQGCDANRLHVIIVKVEKVDIVANYHHHDVYFNE